MLRRWLQRWLIGDLFEDAWKFEKEVVKQMESKIDAHAIDRAAQKIFMDKFGDWERGISERVRSEQESLHNISNTFKAQFHEAKKEAIEAVKAEFKAEAFIDAVIDRIKRKQL